MPGQEFQPVDAKPGSASSDRFRLRRARVLRRRIFWFTAGILLLLVLSVLGSFFELDELPKEPAALKRWYFGFLYDALIFTICAAGVVYIWRWKPERSNLVVVLSIMTIAGIVVIVPFEIVQAQAEPRPAEAGLTWWTAWRPGFMAMFGIALIFGLAVVLVPMHRRESLPIAAIAWAWYLAMLLAIPGRNLAVDAVLAGLLLPQLLVGIAWSDWRFAEFDASFRAGEIRQAHGELTAELSQARRLHEALFPPPVARGPVRVAYEYEPMREIGGDFLFVHPLSHPPAIHAGPIHCVLLDVTGHGIAAALAVNRLHGELQRLVSAEPDPSPGRIIADLNAFACASLTPSGMYASALAIRVDPSGELRWSSAGHPPAFVRRGAGAVETLAATTVLLGVVEPGEFVPGESGTRLARGHAVVAFTDGAMEARDAEQRELGAGGISSSLAAIPAPGQPGDLARALMRQVRAHRVGRVTDDTLIVELGIEGD